jgi:hypothetical protein
VKTIRRRYCNHGWWPTTPEITLLTQTHAHHALSLPGSRDCQPMVRPEIESTTATLNGTCGEPGAGMTGTPGSGGNPRKRIDRKTNTAPWVDLTPVLALRAVPYRPAACRTCIQDDVSLPCSRGYFHHPRPIGISIPDPRCTSALIVDIGLGCPKYVSCRIWRETSRRTNVLHKTPALCRRLQGQELCKYPRGHLQTPPMDRHKRAQNDGTAVARCPEL